MTNHSNEHMRSKERIQKLINMCALDTLLRVRVHMLVFVFGEPMCHTLCVCEMLKNSMKEDQIELIYLMAFLMPASLSATLWVLCISSEKIALTCVPRTDTTHAFRLECFIHDTYTYHIISRMYTFVVKMMECLRNEKL